MNVRPAVLGGPHLCFRNVPYTTGKWKDHCIGLKSYQELAHCLVQFHCCAWNNAKRADAYPIASSLLFASLTRLHGGA
jgi:hypothetical protein